MGRPAAQFCVNGHDTHVIGRRKNGACIECHRFRAKVTQRDYRERRKLGVSPGAIPTVSTEPLRRLLHYEGPGPSRGIGEMENLAKSRAAAAWSNSRGTSFSSGKRTAERLFSLERITIYRADEWCIALGTHLAVVYPEVYEAV